jgi:uncharacterized protein with FMN-binding domain
VAKRLSRRLLGLSASAVAAVYVVGLRASEAALYRDTLATPVPLPGRRVAPAPVRPAGVVPVPVAPGTVGRPGTASAPLPGAIPAGAEFKDGTFTGSGDSRRGGFDVAVTVKGGAIADVQITRVFTYYPVSRVAALPGQIIARQNDQVDRVSGATYSVQAFQQAVRVALTQALATEPAPPGRA